MPTYKSTGISASLVVADLAGTLCDAIQLRMGPDQREEAERIKLKLLNGRTLQERPVGQDNSTVGVFQFVGDERDMALFVVEAGEPKKLQDETRDYSLTNLETTRFAASASVTRSLTDAIPKSTTQSAQEGASRKKKTGNNKRTSTNSQKTPTTPSPKQKHSQRHAISFEEPLALSLKIDCAHFILRDDLRGKDLKIEIFLNGQLVDVTLETQRLTKKDGGNPLHSGTRFHRQAEKPWTYIPGTASSNTGELATQRWTDISKALGEEASQRGTNHTGQRPMSAQFLIALAQLQLPDSTGARSGNFAVMDVIITAGKGRKHGPETSYITTPTRLHDGRFSGVAPIDDVSPYSDPYGYLEMQDAFTAQTPFGDLGLSNFQSSNFMDPQVPMYPEQQNEAPPSPPTPKPDCRSTQTYHKVLEGTPIKKLLSTYENSRGHIKGRRTLRQRLGDMTKMSPKKRNEVMNELKNEVDQKTMETIERAFEMDHLDPTTPSKINPHNPSFALPPLQQQIPNAGSLPSRSPYFIPELAPSQQKELRPSQTQKSAPPITPTKISKASALSNSPMYVPVKKWPRQRRNEPRDDLSSNEDDEQQRPSTPSPVASTTPASKRSNRQWLPNEQKSEQALENFKIPDLCVGSAVSYAAGLQQRQVPKARGGDFDEQQFVVGMRFIVL